MKSIMWLAVFALSSAAGAQELWHVGKPADTYGIYYMVPIQMRTVGSRGIEQIRNGDRTAFEAPNMNVNTKQEKMLGRIDAKTKDLVYNDLACHYFDTTYQVERNTPLQIKAVYRRVESWIDFKGVVKRVRSSYQDERNRMEIDALFGKDTIEMDIVENGKPRHLSLTPSMGIGAFSNPISQMIKNASKDRKEMLFCTIDPATAGIVQYTLRLKGRFVPPVGSTSKISGYSFELKAPKGVHTMFVSDDGQLRQIDYSDTSVVRAVNVAPLGGG